MCASKGDEDKRKKLVILKVVDGIVFRTGFYTFRTAENAFRVVLRTNERVIWEKVLQV